MSSSVYYPLLLLAAFYAGASIAASRVGARGETERSERLRDLAFGAALLAAAYTAVLTVVSAIDTPNRFMDAVTTILVMCGFFLLLLVVLFLITKALSVFSRRPEP